MPSKIAYMFYDCETTGADRFLDEVWSASWSFDIIEDNKWVETIAARDMLVHHSVNPSPWVMANTEYSRFFTDNHSPRRDINERDVVNPRYFIAALMVDIARLKCPVYLVAANPSFDDFFIERLRQEHYPGQAAYDYHLIDVEAMAMGWVNNYDERDLAALRAPDWPGTNKVLVDRITTMRTKPPRLKDVYFAVTRNVLASTPHNAHDDRALVRDCFWAMTSHVVNRPAQEFAQ